jgi:hypothetical protein
VHVRLAIGFSSVNFSRCHCHWPHRIRPLLEGESANKKCRNEELKAACKRRGCTRTELGALARKVQFMQKLISLLSSSAATRQALDARAIELRPVAVKGKKRKIAPQGKHKGKRSNKGKVRAMVSSSEDSNSEEDDSDAESDQEEEFVQEPAAEAFANREPNAFATFGDAYAVSWQATEAFAKSKGLTLVEFDATRTSAELATDKLFPGGKVGKMCGDTRVALRWWSAAVFCCLSSASLQQRTRLIMRQRAPIRRRPRKRPRWSRWGAPNSAWLWQGKGYPVSPQRCKRANRSFMTRLCALSSNPREVLVGVKRRPSSWTMHGTRLSRRPALRWKAQRMDLQQSPSVHAAAREPRRSAWGTRGSIWDNLLILHIL